MSQVDYGGKMSNTNNTTNRFKGMTKAELEKCIALNPELSALVEAIADAKVSVKETEKKEKAKEIRAENTSERVKISRELSGVARLNIPKAVAKAIASWNEDHKRYDNIGRVFLAISYRKELELTDTRKYHIARSIDESGFYLYPAQNGNNILCYVNITMKNARQFMFVDEVGRKEVEKYLSTLSVMDRVL